MEQTREKNGVKKVVGFYVSVREHEWTIIVEAENAHGIKKPLHRIRHICL